MTLNVTIAAGLGLGLMLSIAWLVLEAINSHTLKYKDEKEIDDERV